MTRHKQFFWSEIKYWGLQAHSDVQKFHFFLDLTTSLCPLELCKYVNFSSILCCVLFTCCFQFN
jgi:hypothetical protein